MRRVLGHYRKQPREVLDYSVDYNQWLIGNDLVATSNIEISPVTDPPLEVSNTYSVADGVVGFSVSSGKSGSDYQLTILTSFTSAQILEREITFTVEEL